MSDIDKIMLGPRLKIERAHGHIDELRRRIVPLDPTLYEIAWQKTKRMRGDREFEFTEITFRPKKPISETLSLVIGDAVHNLRAALDHLANQIVRTWHPSPPKEGAFFPMSSKWEDFVTSRHFPTIEQALPNSKEAFLKEIRPKDGPNERFWAFNSLDNDDKHNLILPTVTLAQVSNINIDDSHGNIMRNCGAGGNASRPILLLMMGGMQFTVKNDFDTAVDVKFSDGTPFKDDPVVPTLVQISQVITETLDWFEAFMRRTKP